MVLQAPDLVIFPAYQRKCQYILAPSAPSLPDVPSTATNLDSSNSGSFALPASGSMIRDIAELATPCIQGFGKLLCAPFLFAFHVVALSACTVAQGLMLAGGFLSICYGICTSPIGPSNPPLSDLIFLPACFQWANSQWQELFSS